MSNHDYWLVGAMMGGSKDGDMYKKFIECGYWFMGWFSDEQPLQVELSKKMKKRDRIAIKKMLGQGASEISIRAPGIIKEVSDESFDFKGVRVEDRWVHVDWLVTDLNRKVPARGCFGSIHGPFSPDDEWTRLVFSI